MIHQGPELWVLYLGDEALLMRRRVIAGVRIVLITIVMQRDTVELLKRIDHFTARSGQTAIQRHTFYWHGP